MFKPQRLLVTGGLGFIGSCFIQHWLRNHSGGIVVNVDAMTYAANPKNVESVAQDPRYHFVQADIVDQSTIERLLTDYEIDTVVHFAAESHVDRSITGPDAFIKTNVMGTFSMVEAARKVWKARFQLDAKRCRFHHISTDEVYGTLSPDDPAFSETTPYAPNSPYSASKAGSDHVVRAYFHTYQLPVTISNCSNNYGPHQHAEKLIPTVINSALQGKAIPVYGDGSNIRDWLYVYDHCQAIEQILTHGVGGEAYNVGGDCEVNNLTLVRTICELLDQQFPKATSYAEQIRFVTDRPGHDWRYAIDHRKITQALGWQPQATLQDGLLKTIAYYTSRT